MLAFSVVFWNIIEPTFFLRYIKNARTSTYLYWKFITMLRNFANRRTRASCWIINLDSGRIWVSTLGCVIVSGATLALGASDDWLLAELLLKALSCGNLPGSAVRYLRNWPTDQSLVVCEMRFAWISFSRTGGWNISCIDCLFGFSNR